MSYKSIADDIALGKEIIRLRDYENSKNFTLESGELKSSEGSYESRDLQNLVNHAMYLLLTEEQLTKNADKIDWMILSGMKNFPEGFSAEFIEKFSQDIPWMRIARHKFISSEFIVKYKQHFDFDDPTIWNKSFNEAQVREIAPYIKTSFVRYVNYNKIYSEDFIRTYMSKLDLKSLWHVNNLSTDFLLEFQKEFDWSHISSTLALTEESMEKLAHLLDWNAVLCGYILSDRIIEKFQAQIMLSHKRTQAYMKENFIKQSKMRDDVPHNPMVYVHENDAVMAG